MAPTSILAKTITLQVGPSLSDPAALTEFRQSAAKDASNWNSLLRWHRRNRGPQWDYSTAMYQVDQGSAEYYAGPTPYEPPTMDEDDAKSPEHVPQSGRPAIERSSPQQPSGSLRSGDLASTYSTNSRAAATNLPPMPQPQLESNNLPAMPAPLSQQFHPSQHQIPPQYYQQYQNHSQTKQPRHPGMLQKSP